MRRRKSVSRVDVKGGEGANTLHLQRPREARSIADAFGASSFESSRLLRPAD